MATPLMCFYHVQGDKGDSDVHPNAFVVGNNPEAELYLDEFVKLFPLAGSSPFHFRFLVPSPAGKVYMDTTGPKDRVPVVNGTIIAKVLRLGGLATFCCVVLEPFLFLFFKPSFAAAPAMFQLMR